MDISVPKDEKAWASPTPPRPAPEGAYSQPGRLRSLMLPKNSLKTPAIPVFHREDEAQWKFCLVSQKEPVISFSLAGIRLFMKPECEILGHYIARLCFLYFNLRNVRKDFEEPANIGAKKVRTVS